MADKIIHSSVTNDYENGKLKRKEEEFTIKSQEPDYVKLYVKAWCAFKDIKGINMAFLTALLPYMSYATTGQKIYFNPALKDELCRQLGWSKKSGKTRVNVELDRLKKAGIIKRTAASTYAVNPELLDVAIGKTSKN